jgi:hypothetical protein
VNTLTPSLAISAIGASCVPARPTVIAPEANTSQLQLAADAYTLPITSAQSIVGSVFGMAKTAV